MASITVQAMVLDRVSPTEPPVLALREVPQKAPGPDEVLVELRAAALNRRDLWITLGKYGGIRFPAILGSDGAGVVKAAGGAKFSALVGSEVVINPSLAWGNNEAVQGESWRVLGMPDDGTFAEEICVPATHVHKKPAHLSWTEAAALPLAALTAYRALCVRGELRSAETVLIPGIGSGVSTMVLLLAHHLGARTVVTSSSAEKLERARELGADFGVNYRDSDWEQRITKWCGDRPLDLVIDGVGGETWQRCAALLRPGGRLVSYGATSGVATLDLRRLFWRHLDLRGSTMGSGRDFAEMLALVEAGKLRPVVDEVLPLAEAATALSRMEHNQHMGKIVLKVRE
jgi:NADPH:quinone reductase-like Zn-dependent oxidoreductase